MITGRRLPTFAASRFALIACWAHEAVPALALHLLRHGCSEVVCRRAGDGLVFEAAGAVDLRLVEPVEKQRKIRLGLAREADDEGRADGKIRHRRAPRPDALEGLCPVARPAHG